MPFAPFRRDHLRPTSGIVWGSGSFAVQFGGHFGSGDHLRSGIICGAVQTSRNLYERNEHFFFWTKQLLNWQDKHWHHCCKIAILSWWTKHWPPVHGLPQWTTLKWTIPKNNFPNEYYFMFLAASIIKLRITSAYVHPVQPLATKQLLNTN